MAACIQALAGIVACGYGISAKVQCMVEKGAKLDLAVAEDIRVGCAPCPVFGQKVFKDPVPVFAGKVGCVKFDAEVIGHRLGLGQVFGGGAVAWFVVFFPVFHEEAADLMALRLEQHGGHGRVHSAGEAHHDLFDAHSCSDLILGGFQPSDH